MALPDGWNGMNDVGRNVVEEYPCSATSCLCLQGIVELSVFDTLYYRTTAAECLSMSFDKRTVVVLQTNYFLTITQVNTNGE